MTNVIRSVQSNASFCRIEMNELRLRGSANERIDYIFERINYNGSFILSIAFAALVCEHGSADSAGAIDTVMSSIRFDGTIESLFAQRLYLLGQKLVFVM